MKSLYVSNCARCPDDCFICIHSGKSPAFFFIDQLRVTEGIECAILLYEKEDGNYKVSMRSNDAVDVSAIAKIFGGGGHIKAAGCTVHGQPRDIVMNITHMVEHQLNEQEEKQESIYDKRNS